MQRLGNVSSDTLDFCPVWTDHNSKIQHSKQTTACAFKWSFSQSQCDTARRVPSARYRIISWFTGVLWDCLDFCLKNLVLHLSKTQWIRILQRQKHKNRDFLSLSSCYRWVLSSCPQYVKVVMWLLKLHGNQHRLHERTCLGKINPLSALDTQHFDIWCLLIHFCVYLFLIFLYYLLTRDYSFLICLDFVLVIFLVSLS